MGRPLYQVGATTENAQVQTPNDLTCLQSETFKGLYSDELTGLHWMKASDFALWSGRIQASVNVFQAVIFIDVIIPKWMNGLDILRLFQLILQR